MKPEYIVAIGGSAGSLSSLIKFFSKTSKDSVSYVVLQHISATARSVMSEILGRHSILKTKQIEEFTPLERNTVYTLPPGYYAILADGKFALLKRRESLNCAIDVFLNSLANEYKTKAVAIILSGAGKNGSAGVINIKKNGGFVLAQEPGTCEFASMPEHAIETGCVDEILSPEEMPAAIIQHKQSIRTQAEF